MKSNLYVIKVGGKVIEQEDMLNEFLKAFSELKCVKILIHGGGRIATQIAEQLGYQTTLIEGRRVTDRNMLKVVTMAYGGLLNKDIVSQLQSLETKAIGLTGVDGNLIKSKRRPKSKNIDFGWVGDPISVNTDLLQHFLQKNLVPVVAPLTHDGSGNMLNTNADTIANLIASSMIPYYDTHLAYSFEFDGVLRDVNDEGSLIRELNHPNYIKLKNDGIINRGMVPKLDNAFKAIKMGVSSVSIVNYGSIGKLDQNEYHDYTIIK